MTFTELKAELAARGFDYLSAARQGQYINWARAELDDIALWPYREESISDQAPVAIADLGVVESVLNVTQKFQLDFRDFRELQRDFGDLGLTGTPTCFYVAQPATTPEIATYPQSATDVIGVQYYKVTPDLSAGSDVPLSPVRFHRIIVELAVAHAYRDADDYEAASATRASADRDITLMVQVLMVPQVHGPSDSIRMTGW